MAAIGVLMATSVQISRAGSVAGEQLVELLKPPVTVPIHFDDYDRFKSPLGDFLAEVGRRELPGELRPVGRGDTISLRA